MQQAGLNPSAALCGNPSLNRPAHPSAPDQSLGSNERGGKHPTGTGRSDLERMVK